MALFANIDELKTHTGGAVSKTVKVESLLPFIDQAISDYIMPKIGADTIQELTAATSGISKVAQGLMKSAVAWFAIFEYSTIGNVQFTEGGIMRSESDSFKSAFRYQETAYRRSALKNAWSNLEQLLQLLLDKPTDFEAYHASFEKELNTVHLLNFTTDFARAQCRTPERYTYEALLPYIADVETFCVTDFLGLTLFERLRNKQYSIVTDLMIPEDIAVLKQERQLTAYLRKGIAEMVYHLATVGNLIVYEGSRVISRETARDDDYDQTKTPTMDIISASFNQRRQWADRYFRLAEAYIQDNPLVFPEWIGFADVTTPEINPYDNYRLKML
jgi:hypothetical protein